MKINKHQRRLIDDQGFQSSTLCLLQCIMLLVLSKNISTHPKSDLAHKHINKVSQTALSAVQPAKRAINKCLNRPTALSGLQTSLSAELSARTSFFSSKARLAGSTSLSALPLFSNPWLWSWNIFKVLFPRSKLPIIYKNYKIQHRLQR